MSSGRWPLLIWCGVRVSRRIGNCRVTGQSGARTALASNQLTRVEYTSVCKEADCSNEKFWQLRLGFPDVPGGGLNCLPHLLQTGKAGAWQISVNPPDTRRQTRMVFQYIARRLGGRPKKQQVESEVARRCGFCVAAARVIVYHSDSGGFLFFFSRWGNSLAALYLL